MVIYLFILQFFLIGMSKKTKCLQIINSSQFKAKRIIFSNTDQEIHSSVSARLTVSLDEAYSHGTTTPSKDITDNF